MDPTTVQRKTLTVPEVAILLGISRGSAYDLVREGRIPSVRLGRRIIVLPEALDEWLEREQTSHRPSKLENGGSGY